ncbi:MAG: hypothetical protein IKS12_04385 [Eubacterium sp.]|nr:hypothetical protein [Eubacterium sp.]
MLKINTGIITEIFDAKRLSNEMYSYLCCVINEELGKRNDSVNDKLISSCVDEMLKLKQKK